MQKLKFTKSNIEAIPFTEGGQAHYGDTLLPGFGLRVGRKVKSYYAAGRIKGRKRQVNIGRSELLTVDKARGKALTILAEMAEGVDREAQEQAKAQREITLADAFDEFFRMRSGLSPYTVENYTRTVRRYLPDWRNKPLCQITRSMVLEKHRKISRKYGGTTANGAMRHLRSIHNCISAKFDDFPANPVDILTKTRSWNKEQRRRTLIASHDLPKWWQTVQVESDIARNFLTLALLTGMRRGELAKLRWEFIDFEQRSLHVPHTKNGDPLDLPLSDFMIQLLRDRKAQTGRSPWVFPGNGDTGHLIETKRFVGRVRTNSGVTFTIHDLRRTFITIAESLDIPHYALKRLLNHRVHDDVTSGYIIPSVDRLRTPTEKVTAKILELVGYEQGGKEKEEFGSY